jgi:hypothetical protein
LVVVKALGAVKVLGAFVFFCTAVCAWAAPTKIRQAAPTATTILLINLLSCAFPAPARNQLTAHKLQPNAALMGRTCDFAQDSAGKKYNCKIHVHVAKLKPVPVPAGVR